MNCPDCGKPIERQCAGHISSGPNAGHRCHNSANRGMTVCGSHGGRARQVRAAAQRRVTEEQARALAAKWAVPIETTASQALTDELWRTNGMIIWLTAKVAELDDPVWGVESRRITQNPGGGADRGMPQVEVTQAAKPHPYLVLLQQERAHLARLSADMQRLGLEERQVRVSEAQGIMLAQVIRQVFADVGLTPDQAERAQVWVPRRIRELTT